MCQRYLWALLVLLTFTETPFTRAHSLTQTCPKFCYQPFAFSIPLNPPEPSSNCPKFSFTLSDSSPATSPQNIHYTLSSTFSLCFICLFLKRTSSRLFVLHDVVTDFYLELRSAYSYLPPHKNCGH